MINAASTPPERKELLLKTYTIYALDTDSAG